MKKLLTTTLVLTALSCAQEKRTVVVDLIDENKGCTVAKVEGGSQLSCDDGTEVFIADGLDGSDGLSGQNGLNGVDGVDGTAGEDGTDGIVEIIDPCGDDVGRPDEILIKTSSGELLAWYQDLGLTILEEGTYRTTDSQRCRFTVNADLTITDSIEVRATRERPSGLFIDQTVTDIVSFVVPNSFRIVGISGGLDHSGQQWAHIVTSTTKYCYQMTGVRSKRLDYRFSIPSSADCAASSGTLGDGLVGTTILTEEFTVRMNNSVKKSGSHVTTTVESEIEITR